MAEYSFSPKNQDYSSPVGSKLIKFCKANILANMGSSDSEFRFYAFESKLKYYARAHMTTYRGDA